ncbi:hypothetical protein HanXRQr2_Chr09g0362071 [Helianthus annuus]|uniref:Uncharacterized protein n=1 Tax=Helianthus annuus TaxID=4232 RepID=A0A251TRQ1_HELAN|nr:hypothetical protein HanXRQr2_Chr09g0362071 [Helianthus annuus]KAJ0531901.1 hypothetical protein HanIR_Chr09g0390741 [Helianthus annuus]
MSIMSLPHPLTYASMEIDGRSKYCSRIRVHNTSNKLKYCQSFGDNQGGILQI